MSSYYHAFVPGFNWWYIVAPIMTLWVTFVGIRRFRLTRSMAIKEVFGTRFLVELSVWSTVTFGFMLAMESMDGIVQFCDNLLTKQDSPAWTLITAPGLFMVVVCTYGVCTYFISKFASNMKYNYLRRRIRQEQLRKRNRTERNG